MTSSRSFLVSLGMPGILAVATAVAAAPSAPKGFRRDRELGGIVQYTYVPNGLTVLLVEDHSAPVVAFQVTYRVGSRFEAPGTTGATHLLEHLMFKGSDHFNKEAGTDASRILDRLGAESNATTSTDRTNYFALLPSENLGTLIEIEADRMRNAWLREEDRQAEMTVVRNEYERGENNPFESLNKEIWAAAFMAHPYGVPTIGWRSDIEQVPIEKLRHFYDVYYWPNNATATVVGDFDPAEALKLIAQHFGPLGHSPNPIPEVYTQEPPQLGPRRVVIKRAGQLGVVGIGYKAPRGADDDARALDVLQTILTEGKSSRLYHALIDENLATDDFIYFPIWHDPSLFAIYAFLAPGVEHQTLEDRIRAEVAKVRKQGVTAEEVSRAVSQLAAHTAFNRDGPLAVARELNEWIAMGDWTYYVTILDRYRAVTPEDVQRVAQKYLVDDASTTGWFVPILPEAESGGAPGAAVPGSSQRMPGVSARPAHPGINYQHEPTNEPGAVLVAAAARPAGMEEEPPPGTAPDVAPTATPEARTYAERVRRSTVQGIDVASLHTGLKDVVTIRGSLPAGDVFNPPDNSAVSRLLAGMLDKGTEKMDKFALAEQLDAVGATIAFQPGTMRLRFSAQCLRKDLPLVLKILADELRTPALSEEELEKLKVQELGRLQRSMEDVSARSSERLREVLFPEGHPNHVPPLTRQMEDVRKTTVADLRRFHESHFGPKGMILVAVGDVDGSGLEAEVGQVFQGWQGGGTLPSNPLARPPQEGRTEIVRVADKPSVSVRWGIATGLRRTDADYLPLALGTHALGGNFTARLMWTVRDQEGLTYGIYAITAGDQLTDGYWEIIATFAPELLERGMASTRRELMRWVKEGITAEELAERKDTMAGGFKVALSTSDGVASQLLAFLERGYGPDYLDRYPQLVRALTLEQVNAAIRRYVDPDKLIVVEAGSVPTDEPAAKSGASSEE